MGKLTLSGEVQHANESAEALQNTGRGARVVSTPKAIANGVVARRITQAGTNTPRATHIFLSSAVSSAGSVANASGYLGLA